MVHTETVARPVRVGIVLAGGEARRMGRDKRLLRLGDKTLLERNVAFLRTVFPTVGVSVRNAGQAPPGLPADVEVVPDIVPGSPLAGLASILTRYREPVFALAADVAFPERAAVESILAAFSGVDVALPVAENHLEPLHAVYGPGCLPHIERLLACGAHSILDLYPEVRVARVEFASVAPFFNVNTPDDWAEARRRYAASATPAHPAISGGRPIVLGVVGRSGSGKTTLIERLIPEFTRRGLRVGAVKSVASFDFDVPGKDSWRHAQAGAAGYAVASASQLAFVTDRPAGATLTDVVSRYFADCDLVVCEGFRREAPHVIEVVRPGPGRDEPVCAPDEVLALVTAAEIAHPHRFHPDQTERLVAFLSTRLGLPEGGA